MIGNRAVRAFRRHKRQAQPLKFRFERVQAGEDEIKSAALASETVQKYLEGREPKKVIVANKRLVNVVV